MHQEHSQQILTAEKRRRKREADEVNGDKAANTQEREGRQAAELREGRQAPEPRHEKDHVVRARYCFRLDHEKHPIKKNNFRTFSFKRVFKVTLK